MTEGNHLIHHFKGITLIELVITLTVLGILALAAIPSVITFVQNHRLASTADQLAVMLQYARSEAIKRNTNVYVSFTSGDNWCYGIQTGSACDCTNASNCNLGAVSAQNTQQISLSTSGLTSN